MSQLAVATSPLVRPPKWATGNISTPDALFMSGVVRERAPRVMVEVGVASGYSSAVLLQALSGLPALADGGADQAHQPWLYSFDVLETCYFDPGRRVGDAVTELVPELRPRWRLHTGDALAARAALPAGVADMAFIDADHRHPWPTLDLLAVLPLLRPGSWVLLHDVRLAQIARGPADVIRGPQYLFDAWPWERAIEPIQGNTGAVRLDGSFAEVQVLAERLLEVPWEGAVPRATLEALGLMVHGEEPEDQRSPVARAVLALRDLARARPLVIWSAGAAGRACLAYLTRAGLRPEAFVDRDVTKQGQRIDGLVVRPPSSVRFDSAPRPFVAICGVYAHEIAADLDARGCAAGADYLIV